MNAGIRPHPFHRTPTVVLRRGFLLEVIMVAPIKVGEEVKLRGVKDMPIGVVTYNTVDNFCVLSKDGFTYNLPRAVANPLKTGKRYDVESLLKAMR